MGDPHRMRRQGRINILFLMLDLRRVWSSNESRLRDQRHAKCPRSRNQSSWLMFRAPRVLQLQSCLNSLPPNRPRVLEDLILDAQGMTVDIGEETIGRQTERVRTLTFFAVHVRGRARKHPNTRSAKLVLPKSSYARTAFRLDMSVTHAVERR